MEDREDNINEEQKSAQSYPTYHHTIETPDLHNQLNTYPNSKSRQDNPSSPNHVQPSQTISSAVVPQYMASPFPSGRALLAIVPQKRYPHFKPAKQPEDIYYFQEENPVSPNHVQPSQSISRTIVPQHMAPPLPSGSALLAVMPQIIHYLYPHFIPAKQSEDRYYFQEVKQLMSKHICLPEEGEEPTFIQKIMELMRTHKHS